GASRPARVPRGWLHTARDRDGFWRHCRTWRRGAGTRRREEEEHHCRDTDSVYRHSLMISKSVSSRTCRPSAYWYAQRAKKPQSWTAKTSASKTFSLLREWRRDETDPIPPRGKSIGDGVCFSGCSSLGSCPECRF